MRTPAATTSSVSPAAGPGPRCASPRPSAPLRRNARPPARLATARPSRRRAQGRSTPARPRALAPWGRRSPRRRRRAAKGETGPGGASPAPVPSPASPVGPSTGASGRHGRDTTASRGRGGEGEGVDRPWGAATRARSPTRGTASDASDFAKLQPLHGPSPLRVTPRSTIRATNARRAASASSPISAPRPHRMLETALDAPPAQHRGAKGSDPDTGDGHDADPTTTSGAPSPEGKELPPAGDYGVAQVFLSRDPTRAHLQMKALVDIVRHHNQKVIGWRDVPVDPRAVGPVGRASMPVMRQLFIARMCDRAAFERTLFLVRKRAGKVAITKGSGADLYVASLPSRTLVCKGPARPGRLGVLPRSPHGRLQDALRRRPLALQHEHAAVWERAHPYRRIAHNGGSTRSAATRTTCAPASAARLKVFGGTSRTSKPIIRPDGSDSASLDNVVDFPARERTLAPRHDDARAGGVRRPRRREPRARGLLPVPRGARGALGRAGGPRLHRRRVVDAHDRSGLRSLVSRRSTASPGERLGVVDVDRRTSSRRARSAGHALVADLERGRLVHDAR